MSTPAERVVKYLHGLRTGDAQREADLTVADLTAILKENLRLRVALDMIANSPCDGVACDSTHNDSTHNDMARGALAGK